MNLSLSSYCLTINNATTAVAVLRSTSTGKEKDEETGYGYFGARYMDHELMTMWLSVDPMADKYPSMSPYSYCAWNPVKLVDPDGKDVELVVDSKAKTITANINLIFYSESKSVSGKDVENAMKQYKAQITKEWGGSHEVSYQGEVFQLSINVSYSIDNRAKIPNHRNFNGRNNYIGVVRRSNKFRSNVENSNTGHWNMPTISNAAAHEFGHLLGLSDRYDDMPQGGSIPHKGWAGNIMANSIGHTDNRNFQDIVSLISTTEEKTNTLSLFSSCSRNNRFATNITAANRQKL